MKLGGVAAGEGTIPRRALPSHGVSLIGANPLKSIETPPHLLVHHSSEQLCKLPEASSGQYFWILLWFKAKCLSLFS